MKVVGACSAVRIRLQLLIKVDDVQGLKELPFVLVQALDHNIKHGIGVDFQPHSASRT